MQKSLIVAVRRLANSGEAALGGESEQSQRPEELAREFDEAYTSYIGSLDRLPADAQLQSLQGLDSALSAMSGPSNDALWTQRALTNHPRWTEVRQLAANVLALFASPTAN